MNRLCPCLVLLLVLLTYYKTVPKKTRLGYHYHYFLKRLRIQGLHLVLVSLFSVFPAPLLLLCFLHPVFTTHSGPFSLSHASPTIILAHLAGC